MSKQEAWNQRYAAKDLVWGVEPNRFVREAFADAEPRGRALDLACGEGRNAIWLASLGWRVTGVDYSSVAIERGRRLAAERGVDVDLVCEDATRFAPDPGAFALAIVLYMQVPEDERRRALARACEALAREGELFLIGHAAENLGRGVGGPQDPAVLWEPATLARELEALGLTVDVAEHVDRPTAEGTAIDARLRARKAAA